MNQTIKDDKAETPIHWIGLPNGTRDPCDDHNPLRHHLMLFVDAKNYARRLKTKHGLTQTQFTLKPR